MTQPDVPHRYETELIVPGTPEQVWQAIATADGISGWMMPAEIDPRPGGAVAFHMGPDATSHGRVTAYVPERRIAYEEYWDALVGREGADVTPLVTEFLIEARSGGTCVVRVVTSAFGTGADWENEFFEEMSDGWTPILDNLRLYLASFAGRRVTSLWAGTTIAANPEESIDVVRRALAVSAVGDAVNARGIRGHLERSIARHFLVRVDEPVAGFLSFYAFGSDDGSGLSVHGQLFSDDAPAYVAREQPQWQAWLDALSSEFASSSVRPT